MSQQSHVYTNYIKRRQNKSYENGIQDGHLERVPERHTHNANTMYPKTPYVKQHLYKIKYYNIFTSPHNENAMVKLVNKA